MPPGLVPYTELTGDILLTPKLNDQIIELIKIQYI